MKRLKYILKETSISTLAFLVGSLGLTGFCLFLGWLFKTNWAFSPMLLILALFVYFIHSIWQAIKDSRDMSGPQDLAAQARRRRRIRQFAVGASLILVVMLLPYAITLSDGWPKQLAQAPMFCLMILSYSGFVIGCLLIIWGALLGTGSNSGDGQAGKWFIIGLLIVFLGVGIGFMLSHYFEYINPLTGNVFKVPGR